MVLLAFAFASPVLDPVVQDINIISGFFSGSIEKRDVESNVKVQKQKIKVLKRSFIYLKTSKR